MITWFWLSKEVYRSQTSDLWTEAQQWWDQSEKRREEWEEKESVEEDQGARNDRKHNFQLERYKTHHSRSTFGSWHVQELHAAVAQSAFWSQHVQNTSAPERFWKLRSDKKVHALVAPSTCRSQNAKKPLLKFQMWRKYTPFWREAHSQVKSVKPDDLGPLSEIRMWFCRRNGFAPCQKWAKREGAVALAKTMAGAGRLSRWIASFSMVPTSNMEEICPNFLILEVSTFIFEEVSQNCYVLALSTSTFEGTLA